MSGQCRYLPPRMDDGVVVIPCVACGPSRVSVEAAKRLIDPLLGLTGPFGRFRTSATAAERRRLAELLMRLLDHPPTEVLGPDDLAAPALAANEAAR
jgi:hypothetical protein